MQQPTLGDKATCSMCGASITFIGPYWDHEGENKPRHPATPGSLRLMDKAQAFDVFLAALDAAGVKDRTPIIEALYVYREALLKWQREVIDGHARDAELAIRTLRGYTRKEPGYADTTA